MQLIYTFSIIKYCILCGLFLSLPHLTQSTEICSTISVSTNFGRGSCLIMYDQCQTHRQFKKCTIDPSNEIVNQNECLNYCCEIQNEGIESESFIRCAQLKDDSLSDDVKHLLFILGGCIFPLIFMTVLCCCICRKSEKKIQVEDDKVVNNCKMFNPEQLVSKKIDEISLGMIFVENKNDEMKESGLSDSSASRRIKQQEINEICRICLENKIDCMTSCHHYFHSICLKQWCLRNSNPERCPITKMNQEFQSQKSSSSSEESPRGKIQLRKESSSNYEQLAFHTIECVHLYCQRCFYQIKSVDFKEFSDGKAPTCLRFDSCR